MATMTGTVIPNLMIIHASVTIQESIAARIGNHATAVQIARRDRLVPRVRLAPEVLLAHKVFRESEARWVRKVLKALPVLLARRARAVKQVRLDRKDPPA